MGLFDKAFSLMGKTKDESVQSGFINMCIAAAGADGHVSEIEGRSIMTYVSRLKMFEEINEKALGKLFDKAFSLLESKGSKAMIAIAKDNIPEELRPTVFAVVADIILADGELEDEEQEILEETYAALGIPESTAVTIIEVMMIKNKL